MKVVVIDATPSIAEVVTVCFQLRWSNTIVLSAGDSAKGLGFLIGFINKF
ncbi:hypothetical protein ES703_25998 [subsurface metagenome]